MKYSVVTTFHQPGLEQYGQRMIDSLEKNWPADVDLYVYAENCQPRVSKPNTHVIDLLADSADLRNFLERHRNNPMAHGKAGPPDVFNPKKQFRWDAVRFCYKVYALSQCAERVDSGWLIWLDADSYTHSTFPTQGLKSVCPQDTMISYLGRTEKYHSECGWVAYNLDHPATRKFIKEFRSMYDTDAIFQEKEWHDSYIFDVVRRRYKDQNKLHDLNANWDGKGLAGHPFINSELGLYMDHVKGSRKEQGHSKPKEIVLHQDHPYWRKILEKRR